MKVSQVVSVLEAIAPPSLAEERDNVGLLIGDAAGAAGRLLLCIDLTMPVLREAVARKARMVMAYHPPIYKPVSRLTAQAAPVVYAAARHGLAVYSMHTALDAAIGGTNHVLADMLGLSDRRPLEPSVRRGQCKVTVFLPPEDLEAVSQAAFAAGAGRIGNYYDCAFSTRGLGAFCGNAASNPRVGEPLKHEAVEELRLELICPCEKAAGVCAAIRRAHSYETVAIDVYPLEDFPQGCGMGRVGRLERPLSVPALVGRIKASLGVKNVMLAVGVGQGGRARGDTGRATSGEERGNRRGRGSALVSMVACGAGSCGDLWKSAAAAGASFYLTGEMRHHDLLAATAAGLTVACVGHSNSERPALARLAKDIARRLSGLEVIVSREDREPFQIA